MSAAGVPLLADAEAGQQQQNGGAALAPDEDDEHTHFSHRSPWCE